MHSTLCPGNRARVCLAMSRNLEFRVGVDLGGTKTEAILMDAAGAVRARRRVPSPRGDYEATVKTIRDLVDALTDGSASDAHVGVGIPGCISPGTGLVKNANSTWLIGRPLDRDLSLALGRPVRIGNDADCFALSEATDGAAAGFPNVFGVILGTGVGGGLVVNGMPVLGPNAIAGEWGHNSLPWRDELRDPALPCYCGKEGCIETYLSGPGWSRHFALHHGRKASAADIALSAETGDPDCKASLAVYHDRLARALSHVVNIFDPHAIVLGGGLSAIDSLYEVVPRLWGRYAFSDSVSTKLLPPKHGDSSGVRGAAWLWSPMEQTASAGSRIS